MTRRPLVIVAAHPDDETVGASALLRRTRGAAVVFLTDGAPRDPRLRSAPPEVTRAAYAALRRGEARAALGVAGLGRDDATWLGGIDQEAVAALAPLARALAEALAALAPRLVLTHSFEGGHPDHDAAALAVRAARALLAGRAGFRLWEMTSYHALNGALVTGAFLPGPPAVTRVLAPEERTARRRMLDAYASQREVLAPFGDGTERYRPAPPIDLSRPPHEGGLHYERMGWTTWDAFRAAALAGLRALGIAGERIG